jgi:aminoglycoside phosphotransferase (APT) family kinase protein
MIASIERATGLTIHTSRVVAHGGESVILEANDEWMFRFPRPGSPRDNAHERLRFLASFAKVSPLAVPDPVYVTEDFVGYRKIAGAPLYPTRIARLPNEDKLRIAKQLGAFLVALHHHEDKAVAFCTGYFVNGSFPNPVGFARHLDASEFRKLEANLRAIADNPANFVEPTRIIHGDLYFGNMLWDERTRVVTGIIDWSAVGRGIPVLDFISLADFTTDQNDHFLRDVIREYGGDDLLFHQVKEDAILEVMNWYWCYEHRKDHIGMTRSIKRLKRLLSSRP